MAKALSPEQIQVTKIDTIPDFVYDAVNRLLAKKLGRDGKFASFTQEELLVEALSAAPEGTLRQEFFDNGWLDIEESYRRQGWRVQYDKPGYCETYEAFFTFSSR